MPESTVLPPALPSVVPKHLLTLLRSDAWGSDPGSLAIQTVKTQLMNHERRESRRVRAIGTLENRVPSLFDFAAQSLARYIGMDAEEDLKSMEAMEGLPPNVLGRVAQKLENISYDKFCKVRQFSVGKDIGDTDEWVLLNEVWLRETSIPTERLTARSSKISRGDGGIISQGLRKPDWTHGLVRLFMHADFVFAGSILSGTCRMITRSTSLSGFKVLDERRSPIVRIQPSVEMFSKTFEIMTGGLLKGLDWGHVFVAGGIALGALLCTNDKEATNTPEQWKSSDVDLYIYGLGPIEANKKIEDIFNVFKGNLPDGAPVLVVRNSKTITFFSSYPIRRIQVVLKLVDSPRDVLLNFDLDVCAVGWDGKDVWMLPRAARAIETGYTVFTMDLINGHYLGDRRATQEQRVFKYADKGYGIRILPSYLQELRNIRDDHTRRKSLGIIPGRKEDPDVELEIHTLAQDARNWTAIVINGIAKVKGVSVPDVSHSWLQEKIQVSEDPQRRSVLSGFSLFMRHAALWEYEVAGTVIIKKDSWASWAAPLYDDLYFNDFGISYDDAPRYSWDDDFTTERFITSMIYFNQMMFNELDDNFLQHFGDLLFRRSPESTLETFQVDDFRPQRITHADSVRDILQPKCDIYLPVWLPKSFIEFANDLIPEAVRESGVRSYTTKLFIPALKDYVPTPLVNPEELHFVTWRMTSITMWQQLNRTIDEVHEILWSFHYANAGLFLNKSKRLKLLVSQISRRAIRLAEKDEYGEFARWVARIPAGFANYNNVLAPYLDPDLYEEEELEEH